MWPAILSEDILFSSHFFGKSGPQFEKCLRPRGTLNPALLIIVSIIIVIIIIIIFINSSISSSVIIIIISLLLLSFLLPFLNVIFFP